MALTKPATPITSKARSMPTGNRSGSRRKSCGSKKMTAAAIRIWERSRHDTASAWASSSAPTRVNTAAPVSTGTRLGGGTATPSSSAPTLTASTDAMTARPAP